MLAELVHRLIPNCYLAAVFVSGRFVGFCIFPVGPYPTFRQADVKMWMLATCSKVSYLIRLASEYRRGRHFKHKPMTEWHGER
jgi:hypothetical protein